jgi:hypothetical protein
MSAIRNIIARSCAGNPKRERGFTLVSMTIGVLIGTLVLAGAWQVMVNYQAAMKVSYNDREMDQYAASVFKELTDILSWSWGGEEISGGTSSMRWKFLMNDQVNQWGNMQQSWELRYYRRDPQGFITITYSPSEGILYNGSPSHVMLNEGHRFYHWQGGGHSGAPMDRRDRVTMEGLQIDFNNFIDAGTAQGKEAIDRQMVVVVSMNLHYVGNNTTNFGLFRRGYVREKIYKTQIAMRNWDTPKNQYRTDKERAAVGS